MIQVNDRVLHPAHPEYGFGIVNLVQGSLLDDDPTCQVAFDWKPGLEPVAASSLQAATQIDSKRPIRDVDWGGAEELQRRLGAALAISENSRTGTFTRSFTKPLPHQAYLLDKIVSHNRYGHMIADDVGMGKTIEAGLLIVTERQRNPHARILVLSPAGVVLQWQDEMDDHFGLEFSIIGRELNPTHLPSWKNNSLFLSSLDTLKQEQYRDTLAKLPPFDLVICDEAHRLTARRNVLTGDLETTQNYRFIQWLTQEQQAVEWVYRSDGSPRSPRLIMLSATPHQGDEERFARLLQLGRPDKVDLEPQVEGQFFNPGDLSECITRTAKKRAVDWAGKSIFMGHESRTLDIDLSGEELEVLTLLTRYVLETMTFKDGGPGDALTRALAMHTFQKIAASSWAALESAMSNRLSGTSEENDRIGSEGSLGEEFGFGGGDAEGEAIKEILAGIKALPSNSKWEQFRLLVTPGSSFREAGDRVLIFTQYRRTQSWLREKLESRGERVAVIHGGLSLDERKAQRVFFECEGTIMISTEAGSEGANLHRKCHLEINYDLPWNPMRLLQRIGRLDRYGQKHRVRVVNLRAPSSWDSQIALRIDQRLGSVQQDMGLVADEDYRAMILGEIHGEINVAKVMASAKWGSGSDAIESVIEDAIQRTLSRKDEFNRLFDDKLGMPDNYDKTPATLSTDDFRQAFTWAAGGQDVTLKETRTSENKFLKGVYHFTLPPAFKVTFKASKEVYLVFDREIYAEVKGEVLGRAKGQAITPSLGGFGDPVTDWFFRSSLKAGDAHSVFAVRRHEDMPAKASWWITFVARWKRSASWAGPDAIYTFALDVDGEVVEQVSTEAAFGKLAGLKPGAPEVGSLPQLSSAQRAAVEKLKATVPAGLDQRHLNLFPLLVVKWTD
jgi:superfamily II DNA or RNA helicase